MLTRLRIRTSAVAFDVGRGGVRAAQARARGRCTELLDLLRVELPPPGVRANDPNPMPQADRLVRLVSRGGFRGGDVALVLAPPDVHYHTLRFPPEALRQPPERVIAALTWEVARETRTEPADLEIRYWRLPPGHREGLNVMAVAMPARKALELAALFDAQGARLRRIEASATALVRAALTQFDPQPRDLWGVLDLGLHHSQLIAVLGETPVYVRALPVWGEEWTRRLAEGFEIRHDEAEQIKRRYGIQSDAQPDAAEQESKTNGDGHMTEEDGTTSSGSDIRHSSFIFRHSTLPDAAPALLTERSVPLTAARLLHEPLARLVREINVCFSYVLQYFPDAAVSRLLLSGGGAAMPGLAAHLKAAGGLPVAVLCGLNHTHGGNGRTTHVTHSVAGEEVTRIANSERQMPEECPHPVFPLSAIRNCQFPPDAAAAVGTALLDLESPCAAL